MSATISLTQSDVMTAVRSFLLGVLPSGVEVVRGFDNRVPAPTGPNFVQFWMIGTARLSTNWNEYVGNTQPAPAPQDGKMQARKGVEARVQIDFYGPAAEEYADMVSTLWRDPYGCDAFAAINPEIQPLHADDAKNMPIVNGESQYEQRFMVEALLQINPVTTVPQDFAEELAIEEFINVDAAYPPGA
ncbi:phage neck terminator protein [Pandoraea terrigena]|uniref:Phage neck terminator protein gp12-like domain-containing protein n=1 Tax=Pandoraea terrigena TaxID=2508292 RepID=A0A5E4V5B4_9BURK|nr:hypothetical protein [Pandoraea terrigena]VVE07492.1 hypothetical protein PTE31013_02466 [Pandoraea terrigena]